MPEVPEGWIHADWMSEFELLEHDGTIYPASLNNRTGLANLFADPTIKKSRVIQYARRSFRCIVDIRQNITLQTSGSRLIYSRSLREPAIDGNELCGVVYGH